MAIDRQDCVRVHRLPCASCLGLGCELGHIKGVYTEIPRVCFFRADFKGGWHRTNARQHRLIHIRTRTDMHPTIEQEDKAGKALIDVRFIQSVRREGRYA